MFCTWYNNYIMNDTKEPFTTRFFVLPIISGILLALTLPWFNFSFFAWIAIIPLLLFITKTGLTYMRAFQGGMVTGVVYFSTVVYPLFFLKAWWWLDTSGVIYGNKDLFLFWILYIAVLIASSLFGLFAVVFKKIHKEGFFSIFILGVVWIFLEYVRAKLLFGFTWGHLGYSLHESLPLVQFARYGGVYAVSFLVILINILLYYTIHRPLKDIEGVEGRAKEILFLRSIGKHWYLYGVVFIIALSFGSGNFLLDKQNTESKEQISITIIQPGSTGNIKESEEKTLQMVKESLTSNPALVITSESSFPSIAIDEITMEPLEPPFAVDAIHLQTKSTYKKLRELSGVYPATSFVIGTKTERDKLYYNSIIAFEDGGIKSIYHKRKLFPFSERSVLWFPLKTARPLSMGEKNNGLTIHGEQVSALICSEALFPELINNPNARFIVAIGNDGVFQSPLVAEYNHIIAKFMAVETGKYVVRAMKTGVSSIIDPQGREIVRSQSPNEEAISGDIFPK